MCSHNQHRDPVVVVSNHNSHPHINLLTLWNLRRPWLPWWHPCSEWLPRQHLCDPETFRSSPLCLPGATWACHLAGGRGRTCYHDNTWLIWNEGVHIKNTKAGTERQAWEHCSRTSWGSSTGLGLTLAGANEEVSVRSDSTKGQVHHRSSMTGTGQRGLPHSHAPPAGTGPGKGTKGR